MKIPEDEFIRELLPEFIDDWVNNINENFDNYFSNKDSAEMYRLAHTLKGSCFQFSLDLIANTGIELMELTKLNDWNKIEPFKKKLLSMFEEVNNYITELGLR